MEIFNILEAFLGNYYLLLIITSLSFVIKSVLLFLLSSSTVDSKLAQIKTYLILALLGSIVVDAAWIAKISQLILLPNVDSNVLRFFLRITWVFDVVFYQSLALFLENFVTYSNKINMRQKINISLSSFYGLAFIFSALSLPVTYIPVCIIEQSFTVYALFLLMVPTLFAVFKDLKSNSAPVLLKKQIHILLTLFILPYLFFEFVQYLPFVFTYGSPTNSFALIGICNFLLILGLLYCTRKIIRLRFLNIKKHVTEPMQFHFMNDFKEVLGQLSLSSSLVELHHIAQKFFKQEFNIPFNRLNLYFRKNGFISQVRTDQVSKLVESFLQTQKPGVIDCITKQEILITDEIAFSNFYQEDAVQDTILQFMDAINADIFLPLYLKNNIVAYIIIERKARGDKFYSSLERDQMIIFASYVANIINLLQTKNMDALMSKQKELEEQLYYKHQENTQYRESIRSFLRSNQRDIGIIYYKNYRFVFANKAAKKMVQVNLNTHLGHPVSRALKQLVDNVQTYKQQYSSFVTDAHGNKLVLSGVPHLEQNMVIITCAYPEISDVVKQQLDMLKDPSEWDYLLYLETTKSGQLINQLIPGKSEQLLQFKIDLLKTALTKKATLLQIPSEDTKQVVELLHHISLRQHLHMLSLTRPEQQFEMAIKLFGINPLFSKKDDELPLLQKLDEGGTLFIENIDLLSFETQENLAEFIRYGYFKKFKSEEKVTSSVRIICSTNKNVEALAQEGKFSAQLLQELQESSVSMPSLLCLPESDLVQLADSFIEQATKTDEFSTLLSLSDRDKKKLLANRAVSLHELKTKVQQLVEQKSKQNNISYEKQETIASQHFDPDIQEAARLGKKALQDPQLLAKLWDKFQSQNKIATVLGVNRSSVNRRCKEYNIGVT